MAISDIREPGSPVKMGPACSVCEQLETLPPDEATALRKLLADPLWRYTELADALRAEGLDLQAGTLSRHARGRCSGREKLR